MVTKSTLDKYREIEREKGRRVASKLLTPNHTIADPRALYPEYKQHLTGHYGLHRPGVNIGVMLALYPKVIAFVPPMEPEGFGDRFGIDYKSFLSLSEPGDSQMILPLLNHPRHYGRDEIRNGIEELLVRRYPTWERWHSALDSTGGNCWFDEAHNKLCMEGFSQLPEYRRYWERKLKTTNKATVTKEIKDQVRNNFTNLCLVDHCKIAYEIAEKSFEDPQESLADLLYLADYVAYPTVMGAGGIANVRAPVVEGRAPWSLASTKHTNEPEFNHFDGDVMEALLNGLKFDAIPDVFRADFLRQWHMSRNAEHARSAYGELLKLAQNSAATTEEVHSVVKRVITELAVFCKHAEAEESYHIVTANKRANSIARLTGVGGIVTTILGVVLDDVEIQAAGASVLLSATGLAAYVNRDAIRKRLRRNRMPGIPSKLIDDFQAMRDTAVEFGQDHWKQGSTNGGQGTNASSIPIRTTWWFGTDHN